MRTFTPRRSDHPTDSADHFVSGIHKAPHRITAALESVIAIGNADHWAVDGANGYTEIRYPSEDDSDEEGNCSRHTSQFW